LLLGDGISTIGGNTGDVSDAAADVLTSVPGRDCTRPEVGVTHPPAAEHDVTVLYLPEPLMPGRQ